MVQLNPYTVFECWFLINSTFKYSQERLDFNEQLRAVVKQKEAHIWDDGSPENRAKGLELIRKHSDLETSVENLAPHYEVGDGISERLFSGVNPYTVVDVRKNGKCIEVRACKAELDDGYQTPQVSRLQLLIDGWKRPAW